jgi:hypothetical protein
MLHSLPGSRPANDTQPVGRCILALVHYGDGRRERWYRAVVREQPHGIVVYDLRGAEIARYARCDEFAAGATRAVFEGEGNLAFLVDWEAHEAIETVTARKPSVA